MQFQLKQQQQPEKTQPQNRRNNKNAQIFQPFPRHEFTADEMLKPLAELRLTPSGSLVLQKKQDQTGSSGRIQILLENKSL